MLKRRIEAYKHFRLPICVPTMSVSSQSFLMCECSDAASLECHRPHNQPFKHIAQQ